MEVGGPNTLDLGFVMGGMAGGSHFSQRQELDLVFFLAITFSHLLFGKTVPIETISQPFLYHVKIVFFSLLCVQVFTLVSVQRIACIVGSMLCSALAWFVGPMNNMEHEQVQCSVYFDSVLHGSPVCSNTSIYAREPTCMHLFCYWTSTWLFSDIRVASAFASGPPSPHFFSHFPRNLPSCCQTVSMCAMLLPGCAKIRCPICVPTRMP